MFAIDDFLFLFHRKKCNPLLLQCPLCPTSLPVLHLNLIYISLIPWPLSEVTLAFAGPVHSLYQVSRHFPLLSLYQCVSPDPRHMFPFRNKLLAPCPTAKLEDHSLSAVHGYLLNTYFATTLHIGCRSSILILRTRHALVTRTSLSSIFNEIQRINSKLYTQPLPKLFLYNQTMRIPDLSCRIYRTQKLHHAKLP